MSWSNSAPVCGSTNAASGASTSPTASGSSGEPPLEVHAGEQERYFFWGLDESLLEELMGLVHVRCVMDRSNQHAKGGQGLDDSRSAPGPVFTATWL